MDQKQIFRTVVLNEKGQVDLILWQSKDFKECLKWAKDVISKGIDPGRVDILSQTDCGLWVSIWGDGGRCS